MGTAHSVVSCAKHAHSGRDWFCQSKHQAQVSERVRVRHCPEVTATTMIDLVA
jgi:hypothetical protein